MIVRRAAMSSSVGSSKETPRAEENVATSRLAATMSAYRCTDQKPEFDAGSSNHATGASRRSRANSSWGMPRAHISRSLRSTAPAMADSLAPNEQLAMAGNAGGRFMRVAVVRHHEEDSAGLIGAAFEARGAELSVHLFPADGPLPGLGGIDHVVVLGALCSVYDDGPACGWIADELT